LPGEAEEDLDSDKELWEEIKEAKTANLPFKRETVIEFIKNKLKLMPCKNQGYVLDGFPTSLEEAGQIFPSMMLRSERLRSMVC
jgi:adenylate kinase